jgi:hypothetical protein
VSGDPPPAGSRAPRENNRINIAGVSAFVAITSAALYVLGVASLLIPLRRDSIDDWSTAFYAVTVVPKGLVAWYGVTSFLFVSSLAVLVGFAIYRRFARVSLRVGVIISGVLALLAAVVPALVIYHQQYPDQLMSGDYLWFGVRFAVLPALLAIIFAVILAPYVQGRAQIAVLLVFLALCTAGLPYATLTPLELTGVEINGENGLQAEGGLIGHSDGVWHILKLTHKNDPKSNKGYALLTVSNDKAKEICLWEEASATEGRLNNGCYDCPR